MFCVRRDLNLKEWAEPVCRSRMHFWPHLYTATMACLLQERLCCSTPVMEYFLLRMSKHIFISTFIIITFEPNYVFHICFYYFFYFKSIGTVITTPACWTTNHAVRVMSNIAHNPYLRRTSARQVQIQASQMSEFWQSTSHSKSLQNLPKARQVLSKETRRPQV